MDPLVYQAVKRQGEFIVLVAISTALVAIQNPWHSHVLVSTNILSSLSI